MEGGDAGQDCTHFFFAEDGRKAVFCLGAQDIEGVPVVLQDIGEEEADAAVADTHGLGGPFGYVFPVEEILLEFLFGN